MRKGAIAAFAWAAVAFAQPNNLELFLLIGQSNMAGRGVIEPQDADPSANIYTLAQDLRWKPAVDPLHFDKPDIVGVGLGRSFAKVLARERPGVAIGLIPAAFGGTSLKEWSPDGKLFQDAVRRARAAMQSGKLRGILWHQGEADSADSNLASTYRERFAAFVATLRKELNAESVPVVAGALGEFIYTRKGNPQPFARVVNSQLASVPSAVPFSAFVNSAGLQHKGDEVHFDTPSIREFGRRYAHAFLSLDSAWARPVVPGVVIDHWPQSSGRYVGSPSIAILPNGNYVATHDLFGPYSGHTVGATTRVFQSTDKGLHWTLLTEIGGAFWGTLFYHRDALYLLGTEFEYGDTLIRRSRDGGKSWTSPNDDNTGRILKGQFHCSPQPVVLHRGRIWRGMEDIQAGGGWGRHFRAFMMSAPEDADLLKASSWTSSNALTGNAEWLGGEFAGWLEGNAVITPDGRIVDILRVDTLKNEKAAIVDISGDGKIASFDPATGFVDLPGAAKKFTIRFDGQTKLYWSLVNYIPQEQRGPKPASVRNTLALASSPDLRTWRVHTVLLSHPDREKHGFQYVDWQFEGDDLVAVCRTAFDDEDGGARNFHDANFMTFHRVRGFRHK
jgi:hypothetical protein